MPKVTAATVAVTALLALTLTGCAGSADNAADERTAPASVETDAPTETPEPLVAETPNEVAPGDVEAAYLAEVRDRLPANTQIPDATDAQLVEAGNAACEALRSGTDPVELSVISGEKKDDGGYFQDSIVILTASVATLCPDLAF